MGGEAELNESELRYQSVVATMAEGVVLQDASLRILACNEAAERILGLSREQMMGRSSLDPRWRAIHEDGSPFPGETHPVPVTLQTGQPQRDIVMGVHKPDGSLSWISINSLPLFRSGEDRPYAAVCTFSDITARKEAELALAASEGRYRQIVETSLEGIWIADIEELKTVFVNPRMADILGSTVAELTGAPIMDWFEPEDAAILRAKLLERARGASDMYELRFKRRDGTYAYCSIAAAPLSQTGGRAVSLAMVRDLTEVRRAERQLRENEERTRQAFEIARIGWFEDDYTVGRAAASLELREICGLTPDQPMSHEIWDSLIHPDDRATQQQAFARLVQPGGPEEIFGEFRIVRPDRGVRWVRATAKRIPDAVSGRPRLLGVVIDVTAHKALEEQLLQSRKLEGIGRLAGGIAHDFNNLLTAILASVSFAERQLPEAIRGDLATIRSAAERAAELTRQLLAFARKQVIELRAIDLNAVILELERVLGRLVGEHIAVTCRRGPDLWLVRADRSQIEQVVINLAANARDAMPNGGKLVIETGNTAIAPGASPSPELLPGDYVVVTVLDTGEGIDADTLEHIFEPFFTTKRAGTGLGLASVYGTVRQMGGHIAVDSAPGRGSTFRIYLPRASEAEARVVEPPARRPVGEVCETLLLVEDDALLRGVVARGLDDLGYTVHTAADGEEALALARRHHDALDLVITDVVMPRVSGPKLADRLREILPATPILFVSGYTEDVVRRGLPDAGFQVLAKPFTLDELAARVRQLLDAVS
jgi:PAS domain S-box-containing protein